MTIPARDAVNESVPRFARLHSRILGFCLVIFALELGLALLFFPWNRDWDLNWVPVHVPGLASLWMSRYFRGALSGLGLLNIFVAGAELIKQLRQTFGRAES